MKALASILVIAGVLAVIGVAALTQSSQSDLSYVINPTVYNNYTYNNISGGLTAGAPWLYDNAGAMTWNQSYGDALYGAGVESDPQVDVLTAGKFCTTNGSVINCTADAPATDLSSYSTTAQMNTAIGNANTSMAGYANGQISIANTSMAGYCVGIDSVTNTSMRAFVVGVNVTSAAYALGVATAANTSMKAYVDAAITGENTTMRAFVVGTNVTATAYALGVATTSNTTMKTYVDNKMIANNTNDWRVCFNATTCWSIQVNASGYLLAVDV